VKIDINDVMNYLTFFKIKNLNQNWSKINFRLKIVGQYYNFEMQSLKHDFSASSGCIYAILGLFKGF